MNSQSHRKAAAAVVARQAGIGGLAGAVLSQLQGATLVPFAIVLAGSSAAAVAVWLWTERRYPQSAQAEESPSR